MSSGQTKEGTVERGSERDGGEKWEQDSSAMGLNGGGHPRSTCGIPATSVNFRECNISVHLIKSKALFTNSCNC